MPQPCQRPMAKRLLSFPPIIIMDGCAETSFGVFELFDPAKPQSPEPLPSIPVPAVEYFLEIQAYGFVQNSDKLLVQTCFDGLYVLDLAASDVERSWEKWVSIYAGVERLPFCYPPTFFETVENGRFCFANSHGFWDLQEYAGAVCEEGEYDVGFVGFTPPEQEELASLGNHTPFGCVVQSLVARCFNGDEGEEKGEYHFCQLLMECQAGFLDACRLAITVCRVDLKSYKEMMSAEKLDTRPSSSSLKLKHVNTTVVKTHKISYGHDGGVRLFEYRPHLLFTF